MENIRNGRVLILAFDIKTGENNIDQVRDSLREGLFLTNLLFVAPAAYLLTFKAQRGSKSNLGPLSADPDSEELAYFDASKHSKLSSTLEKYSFMTISDENNVEK